jgi:hypothetical protein
MELTPALKEKFNEHVGEHVDKWPATKDDLVVACNNLSEFDSNEKKWFSDTLPQGTYSNPDGVKRALHI